MITYAQFLLLFLGIPLGLIAAANWFDSKNNRSLPEWLRNMPAMTPLVVHVFLALAYTTPWDNYLVATGVWYYNPALVTGLTLGWVPIEEYIFFVLQTLMTGLWVLWLARRLPAQGGPAPDPRQLRLTASCVLGGVWVIVAGLLLNGWAPGTYLGLILIWAIPPILLQLAFGADILWRQRRLVAISLVTTTLYLAAADSLAIGSGTWTIDPSQSLNLFLSGILPIEEFLFFFVTNTLIVFGMVLALACESRERLQSFLQFPIIRTFSRKGDHNFT